MNEKDWLYLFAASRQHGNNKILPPRIADFQNKTNEGRANDENPSMLFSLGLSASKIQKAQLPKDGDSFIHRIGKYKHSNCNRNIYSNKKLFNFDCDI